MLAPVAISQTKDEQVYERLRRGMVDGLLGPGTELNLTTLAAQMGVSRVPVMRACQRLIGEGFLEALTPRGIAVSPLTETRVREEFALLNSLECMAVEGAVARRTPDLLSRLDDLIAVQHRQADKPLSAASIQANRRFHQALWDCVESPYIRNLLALVWDHLEPARRAAAGPGAGPWDRSGAVSEHQAIVDAIAAGDAVVACQAVRRHRQTTVDRVLAAVRALA